MDNTLNRHPAATRLLAVDARTRRVLELRRQISEGTYEVDHRAVAEAIFRDQFVIVSDSTADDDRTSSPPRVAPVAPELSEFARFLVTRPGTEAEGARALTG